jgi:RNA polymerase sigma-70 factor (ECF subfamily)
MSHTRPVSDADAATAVFTAARPRLLGLAYRTLGSVADAEDVVQEAWLRWSAADHVTIERPDAWLTTVTGRLALDRLSSAQRRREAYVGPWLPEPVAVAPGPEDSAVAAESLTFAFLAVLEQLDPVSRVVFLLADVFGQPFDEVAAAVDRTPAACRQMAVRARRKVRAAAPGRPSPTDRQAVDRLLAAVMTGDIDSVMAALSADVVLVSDGGPTRHAARRPVIGPWRVARLLVSLAKRMSTEATMQAVTVNGRPGLFVADPVHGDVVLGFDVSGDAVGAIWSVNAPDKVDHFTRPVELR